MIPGVAASFPYVAPSSPPAGPAPTLVQQASRGGQDGTITLPAAPTVGNLLVSIVAHWGTGISTDSAWTLLSQNLGTSQDCYSVFYRVVQTGDTAGPWRTHTVAVDDRGGEIMFEVSGQNATWSEGVDALVDQHSSDGSFSWTETTTTDNDLIVGLLDCMGGGAFGMTLSSGPDATYSFNSSSRNFLGFKKAAGTAGSKSFSGSFAAACDWLMAAVRIKAA